MSRFLLIGFLWVAIAGAAVAQHNTQMVLRSNDGSRTFTIKRGDFVKIRMNATSERSVYRGSFRRYENGLVYLRGKGGILASQIKAISYRPLASRILFWGMLLVAAVLVEIGFLSALAVGGAWPQKMVKAGFIILGCSVLLHISSLHHARDVPSKWTIEQWAPPPAARQMTPIP